MSPTTRHTVEAYEHTCVRCGHAWWSFDHAPTYCAGCKSKLWDTPRVRAVKASPGAMRQRKWRKGLRAKARAAKKQTPNI